MATPHEFTLFPNLPLELQEKIWKAATPSSRLVQVFEKDIIPWDDLDWYEELQWKEARGDNDTCTESEEMEYEWEEVGEIDPMEDFMLFIHTRDRGLDGRWTVQTQLNKYGFTSTSATPTISHVLRLSPYPGFNENDFPPVPAANDFGFVSHPQYYLGSGQTELELYGFVSSSEATEIRTAEEFSELRFLSRRSRLACNLSIPALLHTCKISREVMKRLGYAIAFPTRTAPASTWFNFRQDVLYIEKQFPLFQDDITARQARSVDQFRAKDRERVKKLALRLPSWAEDDEECLGVIVEMFGNLDELTIIISNLTLGSRQGDGTKWMLLDLEEADAAIIPHGWAYRLKEVYQDLEDEDNESLTVWDLLAWGLEDKLRENSQRCPNCCNPKADGSLRFKVPNVRFAVIADEEGKKKLQAMRSSYRKKMRERQRKERARFRRILAAVEDTDVQ
jgi:hypothetical protein